MPPTLTAQALRLVYTVPGLRLLTTFPQFAARTLLHTRPLRSTQEAALLAKWTAGLNTNMSCTITEALLYAGH